MDEKSWTRLLKDVGSLGTRPGKSYACQERCLQILYVSIRAPNPLEPLNLRKMDQTDKNNTLILTNVISINAISAKLRRPAKPTKTFDGRSALAISANNNTMSSLIIFQTHVRLANIYA